MNDSGISTPGALPPDEALKTAPREPGCYIMRDADGAVLYVGKSKDLKSRLGQYFLPGASDERILINIMLPFVATVELTVTGSEKEALLLENTLIKRYRPPYNVLIRDDKTYFSLMIDTNHPFPRLEVVRRRSREAPGKGKILFGPFTSARQARETVKLINKHFSLRNCSQRDFETRTRPCLRHQMHRCYAPCVKNIDSETYHKELRRVRLLLEGRGQSMIPELTADMQQASAALNFERAAQLRDQIRAVEKTIERQQVDFAGDEHMDAVALYREGETGAAVVLPVRGGAVVEPVRYTFTARGDENAAVLGRILMRHYAAATPPGVILLQDMPDDADALVQWLADMRRQGSVELRVARRGTGRSLIAMALRNARQVFDAHREKLDTSGVALEHLRKLLGMAAVPRRIECFDISIFQGSFAVGSMACFIDGKMDKRQYRRYRIKTVEGMDDFAMLKEVLGRRVRRGLEEGGLPDLMVIDGGKGQLAQAVAILGELSVQNTIAVISLAKERLIHNADGPDFTGTGLSHKPERIFIPGVKNAKPLKHGTAERYLLERIRDEAHDFAIEYHRLLRSRAHLRSGLEDIDGVGPKRRTMLLKHFGSLKRVRAAGVEELAAAPGISTALARDIYRALHPEHSRDDE